MKEVELKEILAGMRSRTDRLAARIEKCEDRDKDQNRRIAAQAQKITQLYEGMALLDDNGARRALNLIKARIGDLSQMLSLAQTKLTVVSEVSRVFPDIAPSVMRSLDFDDKWWSKQSSGQTIREWARVIRAKDKAEQRRRNGKQSLGQLAQARRKI